MLKYLKITRRLFLKNNKSTTFIIIAGVLVLSVFTVIAVYNIFPKNHESNSYYVKVGEEMSAKIEDFEIKDERLIITTSGDAKEYCVKSTKSTPTENSLCWKKIEDNTATISIYAYKKYYIWIKDTANSISSPLSIDTGKR